MQISTWANKIEDVNKPGSFDCQYVYLVKRKKDKEPRKARIIEIKENVAVDSPPTTSRGPRNYTYYVHFLKMNRRLDEWVTADQMEKTNISIEQLKKEDMEASDYEDGHEHIN